MSSLELNWLDTDDLSYSFPPPDCALDDPEGLIAAGGDLTPARILKAYHSGIFPWYQEPQPILWWCPNPRGVLYPKKTIAHKSVLRTLKRKQWTVSYDKDFAAVIRACAEPRSYSNNTWITTEMSAAYIQLHELGHAHSIEIWNPKGNLVGGIYGLSIGRLFAGESMFSRENDASKIALLWLAAYCDHWGYAVIDTQLPSQHLTSMGGEAISRQQYLMQLKKYSNQFVDEHAWRIGQTIQLHEWLAAR